jgi:putative SOS response-associated peptidase YedK
MTLFAFELCIIIFFIHYKCAKIIINILSGGIIMCGRYQLDSEIDQLMFMFNAQNRYMGYGSQKEIFPTNLVAIVTREGNQNFIEASKWGFDNYYDNRPLINARGETVEEKKTFKNMFAHGRCIIPATAFFEWRKNPDGSKTKIQIAIKDTGVFGMAGLYKTETDPNGNTILRCAIITTSANAAMSAIHDRMPVILPSDNAAIWLDNTIGDIPMLKEFLKPYAGDIEFTVVA